MDEDPSNKEEKDLFRVMTWGTAFGFGVTGSVVYSFKDVTTHPHFVFSIGTVVAFVIGAVAGWYLWYVVKKKAASDPSRKG